MHELFATQAILDKALAEGSRRQSARRITDLHIVVGEISTYVDDSVQFYWDEISKGTIAEGAQLHFRHVRGPTPVHGLFHARTNPQRARFCCPSCGSSGAKILAGRGVLPGSPGRGMMMNGGARLHVTGIVQGVGFRPSSSTSPVASACPGWVRNTSAGVEIEVDGPPEHLRAFVRAVRDEAPPLSRIDEIDGFLSVRHTGFVGFEILEFSKPPRGLSADLAGCRRLR